MKNAETFIKNELRDLDIKPNSRAYETIFHNAIEAADTMSKKELKEYIEQSIELLPLSMFY